MPEFVMVRNEFECPHCGSRVILPNNLVTDEPKLIKARSRDKGLLAILDSQHDEVYKLLHQMIGSVVPASAPGTWKLEAEGVAFGEVTDPAPDGSRYDLYSRGPMCPNCNSQLHIVNLGGHGRCIVQAPIVTHDDFERRWRRDPVSAKGWLRSLVEDSYSRVVASQS